MVQVNDVWYDITFEDIDGERAIITITREGEFKKVSLDELLEIVANEDDLNINFDTEDFGDLISAGNTDSIYLIEGYANDECFYTSLWGMQAEYLSRFGMVAIPAYITF